MQSPRRQEAWTLWNQQRQDIVFTAEQTILWLEGMRQFLFEVWKNDQDRLREWKSETKRLNALFADHT